MLLSRRIGKSFPKSDWNPFCIQDTKRMWERKKMTIARSLKVQIRKSNCEIEELVFRDGLASTYPTPTPSWENTINPASLFISFLLSMLLKTYKVTWPKWTSSSSADMMWSDRPVPCCQARAWRESARLLLGRGGAGMGAGTGSCVSVWLWPGEGQRT